MKKTLALILLALVLVLVFCACAPEKKEVYNERAGKVFREFVIQKHEEVGHTRFLIRDIDGDGTDELLTMNREGYSIYGYNERASKGEDKIIRLGNRIKSITSDRFFFSDKEKYPGVFVYSGQAVKTYTYLTLKNDKMICQKLWDDDSIGLYEERDRIVEYTQDKELIKEAQRLYDKNMDIEWMSAEFLSFEGTFFSADISKSDVYNRAVMAYDEFLENEFASHPHQSHAIYDMNNDGIPELLYRENYHLYVCTYYNFKVENIYASGDAMDGTVKILENHAIFEAIETTGKFYSYTTFGEGKETVTISFDCAEYDDFSRYTFKNDNVTKEEWDKLTKKYFKYSEMPEAVIEWEYIKQLQSEATQEAYKDIVVGFAKPGEKVYYLIKDIDGNGVDELLIKDAATISVYTYDDKAKFIQKKDPATGNIGTTRFFASEDKSCPGIFLFGTGGGLEQYNYLTLAGDEVIIEKLWDEDFSDAFDNRERIIEYSQDKNLIAISKDVCKGGKDIVWSEFDAPKWKKELKTAYDDAMTKYKSDPQDYRHLGVPQLETGEIVEIDGQYYQSYVASNVDHRYIFIKKEECPIEIGANWDWVPVGTEKTYSLDLIGKIDEGRK